ncbi:MAG: restriction endonuclease subunit S, partial [Candidatus Gastranaerophilales bacterium]|nr:restriction endonuclease subunit S [Candidatus Gastranaerophilales bacterium]
FERLLTTGLKQEAGQFFTPPPITKFITKSLPLDKMLEKSINQPVPKLPAVIDYAAGSGHFITEVMEAYQDCINSIDTTDFYPEAISQVNSWITMPYSWAGKYIYGIEKDYRLVKVAKVGCYFYGDGLAQVIHGDGLDSFKYSNNYIGLLSENTNIEDSKKAKFSIVVSNPPYSVEAFKGNIKNINVNDEFELYKYLTDRSSEIECLFVERTKQLLKDGGIAGIILPSSILTNTGIYTKTRELLLKYFEIVGITELGSNTFMATGTNTVVLFLRRRNNYDCINLQKSVDKFFETLTDVTINNIETPVHKYVNYVFDCVTIDDYLTLLDKQPNENIKKHDIYKEYKQKINAKNENEFFNKVIEIEKEKLYYFILCYAQKVVIVKTGEKEAEKQFLGYEFSNRRGSEGIHPIQKSKTIEECTKLFDINSFENPQKASTYIYKAFTGDFNSEIDESLKENISRINLIDMMNFDRVDFEKIVNTKSKKKVKIDSKWVIQELGNISCLNFEKGKSITKEKTKTGDIPVVAGGIDFAYTHNESNRKANVITISASGANAGFVNFWTQPIWASDCSTVVSNNENDVKIKYIYEYLKHNQEQVFDLQKGNAQPHVYIDDIKKIKIPLPPLDIQQKIVAEIEEVEETSIDSQKIITNNSEHIDKCINDLSIYNQDKLTNLILLNEQTFNPKGFNQEYFTYIDIESVENGTGKIILDKKIESQKAPSRARRIVLDESVVISTVRPYLKAFTYIEKERENTIFSTGFAIIRSKNKEVLLSKFLYYLFMYSNNLMEQMKIAMPKGQYPSINEDDIKNFSIPVPPLEEQQKIVEQIEKLEQEINNAQQIIDESKNKKQQILDKYLN